MARLALRRHAQWLRRPRAGDVVAGDHQLFGLVDVVDEDDLEVEGDACGTLTIDLQLRDKPLLDVQCGELRVEQPLVRANRPGRLVGDEGLAQLVHALTVAGPRAPALGAVDKLRRRRPARAACAALLTGVSGGWQP
jgi:hypothetical protein